MSLNIRISYSGIRKAVPGDPLGKPFGPHEFYDFLQTMTRDAGPGTWTEFEKEGLATIGINIESSESRYGVKVDVNSVDAEQGKVTLLFPAENFDFKYNGLPLLLGTVAGDIIGHRAVTGIVVEDIEFPSELLKQDSPKRAFEGPNCGITGSRSVVGVSDRPIFAFTVKPRLGLRPDEHAALCYEAAKGGADIVEDDERLGDPEYCQIRNRMRAVLTRLNSDVETKRVIYSVNLTGRSDKVGELFTVLLGEFGDGLRMVKFDVLPGSFSGLQALSEAIRASGKQIPITVYPAMEYVYRTFRRALLLKLSRYCGADIIYAGTPAITKTTGRHAVARLDEVLQHHRVLKEKPGLLRSCMPTVTTSLHPGHIHALYYLLGGTDFAYFIGGAISAHPKGVREGARLVRKTIEHAASGADDDLCFDRKDQKVMKERDWRFLSFREICFENPGVSAMVEQFKRLQANCS